MLLRIMRFAGAPLARLEAPSSQLHLGVTNRWVGKSQRAPIRTYFYLFYSSFLFW